MCRLWSKQFSCSCVYIFPFVVLLQLCSSQFIRLQTLSINTKQAVYFWWISGKLYFWSIYLHSMMQPLSCFTIGMSFLGWFNVFSTFQIAVHVNHKAQFWFLIGSPHSTTLLCGLHGGWQIINRASHIFQIILLKDSSYLSKWSLQFLQRILGLLSTFSYLDFIH